MQHISYHSEISSEMRLCRECMVITYVTSCLWWSRQKCNL